MSFMIARRGVLMSTTAIVDPVDPAGWTEVCDFTFATAGTSAANYGGRTYATRISPPLAARFPGREQIRLTLSAPSGGAVDFEYMYLSTTPYDSDGVRQGANATPVTLDGQSSFQIAAGETVVTDPVDLTWGVSEDLCFHCKLAATSLRQSRTISDQRIWSHEMSSGTIGDAEHLFPSGTVYQSFFVDKVEVGGAELSTPTWWRNAVSPWRNGNTASNWGGYMTRNILDTPAMRPPEVKTNACRLVLHAPSNSANTLVRGATLYLGPQIAGAVRGIGPTAAPVLVAGSAEFDLLGGPAPIVTDPIRLHYPTSVEDVRLAYDQWAIATTALANFYDMGSSRGGWSASNRVGDPTMTSFSSSTRKTLASIEFADVAEVSAGVNPRWVDAANYTLGADRRTVERAGTGNFNRRWVPLARFMGYPDEHRYARFYWEVACVSVSTNARVGVVPIEAVISSADGPLTNTYPNDIPGTVTWFRDGSATIPGQSSLSLPSFETNDILMFMYDALTGQVWFGKGGVWAAGTPVDQESPAAVQGYTLACPYVQLQTSDQTMMFLTTSSECMYSPPTGAVYIGGFGDLQDNVRVEAQTVFEIIGRSPVGISITNQNIFAIVEP